MKRCSRCGIIKEFRDFNKNKNRKDGYQHMCRECQIKINKAYKRSKEGIVSSIYDKQKRSSITRGHNAPEYTRLELQKWVFHNENFNGLYENWIKCGYLTEEKPSIDRLDDYKPYTFSNIRIVTWRENKRKCYADRFNGENNKSNKAVLQLDKNGVFVNEFYSIAKASRETGISPSGIAQVCKGEFKTAGKYKWKYKNIKI